MTKEMQACAQECLNCHSVCLGQAMTHCLEMGGDHVAPAHFRLMINCAEICRTSATFLLSGSEFHRRTCELCAEICEVCAESCDALGDMQECVEACRRCAESCRQMAG
jgi:hypothetical protein